MTMISGSKWKPKRAEKPEAPDGAEDGADKGPPPEASLAHIGIEHDEDDDGGDDENKGHIGEVVVDPAVEQGACRRGRSGGSRPPPFS